VCGSCSGVEVTRSMRQVRPCSALPQGREVPLWRKLCWISNRTSDTLTLHDVPDVHLVDELPENTVN
jgi:hypothetical protein